MIGYVTVGTNDMTKAGAFYDELLAVIGAKRVMEQERYIYWGNKPGTPGFMIIKPLDGQAATVGNGVMVALVVKDTELVKAVYEKALALGGTCEGGPGPRGDSGFYAAYFRDLDGNKLNAFCMVGQAN